MLALLSPLPYTRPVTTHRHMALVVDDHPDVRDVIAAFLSGEGVEVITACDGGEALDHLRGGLKPCVILLDMMMPKVDGWHFRRMQLADPHLAAIPVVVVSAHGEVRARAAASGFKAILAKPSIRTTSAALSSNTVPQHRPCRVGITKLAMHRTRGLAGSASV
jgi:CheY-like chemotaxis protein